MNKVKSTPAIINMIEKDGVFIQDAIYTLLTIDGDTANAVLFNNGIKVLFAFQSLGMMVGCRVSYDFGKNFNGVEQWDRNKFNEYLEKLKSMTNDEVKKRCVS